MRKLPGILFGIFLVFLFLEILIGFPISLEHEPLLLPKKIVPKTEAELEKERHEKAERDRAEGKLDFDTAQSMKGVHLVESRKGARDWELFSEAADNEKTGGQWKLQKVRIFFYNKDSIDFIVNGDRGSIEPGSKDIRIEGNVVTKSANGYVFRSPVVSYLAEKRIIYSPDFIRMQAPADEKDQGMQLTGNVMEAFVETNQIFVRKNVRAVKKNAEGKEFIVTSGSAEFSGKDRTARFMENIQIQVGEMKIEGPEAFFNYRPGVDVLQSIKVLGGVKVSDVDKYATSDTVLYDPEKNDFTFNGRPRVVQNNDEITGEQIVFVDGGKRVKVEKIKAKMEKPSEK